MRGINRQPSGGRHFSQLNSRPSWVDNPASVLYVPGMRPDPSTNVLDLRGIVHWPDFDLALFCE